MATRWCVLLGSLVVGACGGQRACPAAIGSDVREGTLLTIRGHYVPDSEKTDYASANMTTNLFEVTQVAGAPQSLRVELVDPPTGSTGELTLTGYFYKEVATGSLVPGFDPPATQGHSFVYATKFRVKAGSGAVPVE